MELREIKALIDLMHERGLVELEIEDKKGKVRLVRGGRAGQNEHDAGAASSESPRPGRAAKKGGVQASAAPARAGVSKSGQAAPGLELGPNQVPARSPMVGTFYRAASPGAEPFVEEGSHVRKGQSLCIIEAMKMMNEVDAEVSGVVVKILCDNGQPVEYGQPLMILEVE